MNREASTLILDAVRHQVVPFVAVTLAVMVAVVALVFTTPSRYDAVAIVGFAPGSDGGVPSDLLLLSASQFAEAATGQEALAAAEDAAGTPAGTLQEQDVRAQTVPDAAMIQLVVSDDQPQRAGELANGLAATIVASATTDLVDAKVVRAAKTPLSPAAPARGLYTLAGLLAGLGLGLCVALGLEAWHPKVRSASRLASIMGAPTVADLRRRAAAGPPVQEMRLAQLSLTRTLTAATRDRPKDDTVPEVAVLTGGDVGQDTLAWVSAGLVGALTLAGYQTDVRRLDMEPPRRGIRSQRENVVRVLPVHHTTQGRQGLARAASARGAIVVVGQNDPVSVIAQLRHDLEVVGIEVVGSVLIRGRTPNNDQAQSEAAPPTLMRLSHDNHVKVPDVSQRLLDVGNSQRHQD